MRGGQAILGFLLASIIWFPCHSAGPATLEECDVLVRDQPDTLGSFRCFWNVARNQGVWSQAASRLEDLTQIYTDNYRPRLILGMLAADRGEDRAAELLSRAAQDAARAGDAECEVHARVTLAVFLRRRGKKEEASRELGQAYQSADHSGQAELIAEVQIQMGWEKYYASNYGSAWDLFSKVESRVFPDGSIFAKLDTLDGLAAVAWGRGQFLLALETYDRQLSLLKGKDPYRASYIWRNKVAVARELVDAGEWEPEQIVALARETIDFTQRIGNPLAEAAAHLALGESLRPEEALPEIERGLALARADRGLTNVVWGLGLKAETLARRPGSGEAAFAAANEAIERARQGNSPENLAGGLAVRARLCWKLGSREEALRESLLALDEVEKIRDLQPDRETRARVFGRFAGHYRELIGRILEPVAALPSPQETALAFSISERMRARALLDTLDAAGVPSPASGMETSFVVSPEPALKALQEQLAPDQVLLSFVMPGNSREAPDGWVFVITPRQTRVHMIRTAGTLEREILMFRSLLERRDGTEAAGAARLYRRLLQDAFAGLPSDIHRLIWIPDGALHELPLETLRTSEDAPPLAATYEISLAPSAEIWRRWKQSPTTSGTDSILSFADPDGTGAAASAWRQAGGPILDGVLAPLPYARSEAATLRKLFAGREKNFMGSTASEAALKSAPLGNFRILHLAAHAIVDDEHPELSAVLLNPGGGNEDGRLQFREIVDLPLSGQTVLLSACRGASGPVVGGEGVLGLSNAFFHAGAQVVVAGFWPIQDEETADLVVRFGRRLAAGDSVAAALTNARRDLIQAGAPPAAWASLIVLGNGDLVPFPGGRSSHFSWPVIVGSALLLTALLLAGGLLWFKSAAKNL